MCGRFTVSVPIEELLEYFNVLKAPAGYVPRYNAAPGQAIFAVVSHNGRRHLGPLRWGLIPSWAKDEKFGYKTINAKAETLRDKPAFRDAFERRRCLIPADGFYEWLRQGNTKQPMRIVKKNGGLFAMAGLYDTWIAPDGQKIGSCTIITTEPNSLVRNIHDRMPVILRPENESLWLDRSVRDSELLQTLLSPYPAEDMHAYPVGTLVGNAKNDTPECLSEVPPN